MLHDPPERLERLTIRRRVRRARRLHRFAQRNRHLPPITHLSRPRVRCDA